MSDIAQALGDWKASLCKEVDVGGLFARSKVAYKWKAPWRALLLRECVAWRVQDLLQQSLLLHEAGHTLGARVLLRSAFESVAVLVHLNQSIREVLSGEVSFHDFSTKTTRLLLGSRDKTTPYESINIVTVLRHADKRYPGIEAWYAALSESAHPNYEGMLVGYSQADQPNFTTSFSNRWAELYGQAHREGIRACMLVFDTEYNHEWLDAIVKLEQWIETNNAALEASKPPADA